MSKILLENINIEKMSSIHIQSGLYVILNPDQVKNKAIDLIVQKVDKKQLCLDCLTNKICQPS